MSDRKNPSDAAKAMRLRPEPKPVLRLSRKALLIGGTVASLGVGAAFIFALSPAETDPGAATASEAPPSERRLPSEALNSLPKDYASVPKLGPPLPGDLGRPLLASQGGPTTIGGDPISNLPPPNAPMTTAPSPEAQAAGQARLAARTSEVFFSGASGQARLQQVVPEPQGLSMPNLGAWAQTTEAAPKSQSERQQAFLDRPLDQQTVSEARLTAPASPYLLLAGSVVPAALITGIRSDVPGQVLAQITQDIKDSVSGRYVLIPKGARLIGQYDNAIAFGQSRLLLTWSRLILPNGKSLILDKLSAADVRGFAGLEDKTDYHWKGLAAAAAISTLLSISAQAGSSEDESELVRAIRNGAGESANRVGQQIVERQLSVQPSLTIRPGLPVRVTLTRDLILEPYGD